MLESQKIMKMITTWGRKRDQKYLYKKSKKFLKKNYEIKMQEENFCIKLFPRCHLYESEKNLSNFAMTFSQ